MPRYVSKFSTIPDERVATDAVARGSVDTALKIPENRPLCEEMLRCANEREAIDEKYATRAWRRAAIVLAEAPMNLFSEEGKNILAYKDTRVGMPYGGRTTAHAYRFMIREHMKKNLAANPMVAFPPVWRDGMLEDDERLVTALRVADAIVTWRYNLINLAKPLDAIAYTYYMRHEHYLINMMIDAMNRMAGFDEESMFAHIPGLLVAQ
jgi:hypothetical protein